MNLSNNELFVEFLAEHQPDLIKQWHAQTGINALRQLAEEYAPPARNYPLIDERFVFEFIEWLMFLGEDESAGEDSKHRLAEFWSCTSQREQAKHLAGLWFDLRELLEDDAGLMFDYVEFRNEINAEHKAKHGCVLYTPEKQNASEWR